MGDENAELRKLTAELRQRAEKAEAERDEARDSTEFTHEWYAVRVRRLRDLANWPEIAAILANGTANTREPPTHAQLLYTAKHRAERAELERDEARRERDAARAELSASIMSTQMWMDLEAERDEARRERDTSQRTMHLALANVAQAASERDRTRLGTVNESVQPVVDAFMGWISDAETDLAALRRRVEELEKVAPPLRLKAFEVIGRLETRLKDAEAYVRKDMTEGSGTIDELLRILSASPPVAAQGTREAETRAFTPEYAAMTVDERIEHLANGRSPFAKQPDAPGREEER